MKINTFDIVIFGENPGDPFLLVEVNSRVVVGQLNLDVSVADLAFDLDRHLGTWVLI